MTEKCFDDGIIQAFLDGELTPELSETVAHHVALCSDCSLSLARAEEESSFAFSALEQEFNTLVPTQRLWTKINDSIESERKSVWQNAFAFVSNFKFHISNQTITAFASLLIVVGLFTSILVLRNNDKSDYVAETMPEKQKIAIPISKPDNSKPTFSQTVPGPFKDKGASNFTASNLGNDNKEFRAVKAAFVSKESNQKPVKANFPRIEDNKKAPERETRVINENLPGEESYIKTIAVLSERVENRKDEVLKPSDRFAFEKDLAVVDDAIKKMKAEVKKNPKNEGAKQVLLSSYQNKVDLLNSVTEKTELMASLR